MTPRTAWVAGCLFTAGTIIFGNAAQADTGPIDHAYQTCLNRPPETTAVVAYWNGHPNPLAAICSSLEAQQLNPGWTPAPSGVHQPPILHAIAWCESRDSYQAKNRRSTASGRAQFLDSSWGWYGHADRYGTTAARWAEPAEQDVAMLDTWQRDGTRPWNASKRCWS